MRLHPEFAAAFQRTVHVLPNDRAGRHKQARVAYQRTLDLAPECGGALLGLAVLAFNGPDAEKCASFPSPACLLPDLPLTWDCARLQRARRREVPLTLFATCILHWAACALHPMCPDILLHVATEAPHPVLILLDHSGSCQRRDNQAMSGQGGGCQCSIPTGMPRKGSAEGSPGDPASG